MARQDANPSDAFTQLGSIAAPRDAAADLLTSAVAGGRGTVARDPSPHAARSGETTHAESPPGVSARPFGRVCGVKLLTHPGHGRGPICRLVWMPGRTPVIRQTFRV